MKLFVAMPYGDQLGFLNPDDPEMQKKIQFDSVWNGVLKPAVAPEWEAKRADELRKVGLIDQLYTEWLLEADVVLADLTFSNPNVFYELGIRHALSKKSTVLVAQKASKLPFDVRNQSVIYYDYFHAPSLPEFHVELADALTAAAVSPNGSPIHTFLPGLYVGRYKNGRSPNEEIADLKIEIERLRAAASVEQGTAAQFERRLALRSELTNLLTKLIRGQIDNAKLFKEYANDTAYTQQLSSILNQENSFLLNEIKLLIEQIPDLVGANEFATVAYSFSNTYDVVQAEEYYRRAINVAKSPHELVVAQQALANFIFSQGRFEEARSLYQDALKQIPEESLIMHQFNGMTLQRWAWNEALIARDTLQAEELFSQALKEFESIKNPVIRRNFIDGLSSTRRGANI